MGFNSASGYHLKVVDLSDNTTVTHTGGTNIQTLTPPAGQIYEIIDILYNADAPIGDTAGTHKLEITHTLVSTANMIVRVTGAHSTSIAIQSGGIFVGGTAESPGNNREQFLITLAGILVASNAYPLAFAYRNDTDADQTGTRTCEVLVKVMGER